MCVAVFSRCVGCFSPRFDPDQIQLPVLQTHQVRAIPQSFPNKCLGSCSLWMESWFVPSRWSLDLSLSAFRFNSICALPASLLIVSHSLTQRAQDQDNLLSSLHRCWEQSMAGNMQVRGGRGLDFSSQISSTLSFLLLLATSSLSPLPVHVFLLFLLFCPFQAKSHLFFLVPFPWL